MSVGHTAILNRLAREEYNGLYGTIVAEDPAGPNQRLHFRINGTDRIIKVKPMNVFKFEEEPDVPVDEAKELLGKALAHTERDFPPAPNPDRVDTYGRIAMVNKVLGDGPLPVTECMKVMLAPGQQPTPMVQMMMRFRPPCVGNGKVDFTRFQHGTRFMLNRAGQDPRFTMERRMREWFLTGMCEKCQFFRFETMPDE